MLSFTTNYKINKEDRLNSRKIPHKNKLSEKSLLKREKQKVLSKNFKTNTKNNRYDRKTKEIDYIESSQYQSSFNDELKEKPFIFKRGYEPYDLQAAIELWPFVKQYIKNEEYNTNSHPNSSYNQDDDDDIISEMYGQYDDDIVSNYNRYINKVYTDEKYFINRNRTITLMNLLPKSEITRMWRTCSNKFTLKKRTVLYNCIIRVIEKYDYIDNIY